MVSVRFTEVKDAPEIKGIGDFGIICGFDLTHCPYVERDSKQTPLLDGDNWVRVMDECRKLDDLIKKSKISVPQFRTEYDGAIDVTLQKQPKTPTGREPKYPAVVTIANQGDHIEPVDWNEWVDAYSRSDDEGRMLFMKEVCKRDGSVFIARLSFLSSGEVGKADFTVWEDNEGYNFKFIKEETMHLKQVQRKHLNDEV